MRFTHCEPMTIGLETPFRHELGFTLLARDEAHHVLVEPRRQRVGIDVGDEAMPIRLAEQGVDAVFHRLRFGAHADTFEARAMCRSSRSMGICGVRLSSPAS